MKIFLSHSSSDKDIVRTIRSLLPRHVKVWLDEDELDLGVKFPHVIKKAIGEESDFVIVFLGETALKSDWVIRELDWACTREKDLGRTFVLPILLDDVWDEINHASLEDRLYLKCFDHSPEGLRETADKLSQYLFAQVSRHFGNIKSTPPREFLDDFARDLTSYKEIAYRLHASLGDSIAVLSRNQLAFDNIVDAVNQYNEFTGEFIQRLQKYTDRVRQLWGRNLSDRCSQLMQFIENEAYRGQVFALNEVRDFIHRNDGNCRLPYEEIQNLDSKKDELLKQVDITLKEMTNRSGSFLAALEREL